VGVCGAQGHVRVQDDGTTQLVLSRPVEMARELAALPQIARAVHELIEKEGAMGAWAGGLRADQTLTRQDVSKALKQLEQRKNLVHVVRPAGPNRTRKTYVSMCFTPARELVGGAFVADSKSDVDLAMLSAVKAAAYIALRQGHTRLPEIAEQAGAIVNKAKLADDDVAQVLKGLQADDLVHRLRDGDDEYVSLAPVHGPSDYDIPACLRCPLADQCAPGADVSPEACVYYTSWVANAEIGWWDW
jgi:DNA-binding MarR family transcriptional regulator